MVDQNTIFGGMLTNLGAAKKTNCDALGVPWEPRYMLIGDANGTDPVPNPAQTQLVHQVYRAQLNQLYVSPADDKVLVAELVLPPDVGGWWVRELALEDKDGVFSAVANVAPSYKPQLAQNSGRNQVVRMHIITNGTANIQLKIDPSVVLATREYVDTKILEELYKLDSKQSVLVATTANIALAGLQTIDGIALEAGKRVLVKNQTVAKDNGIYIADGSAWKRAADADTNAEVTSALLVSVEQGTTQADTRWQLVTDGVIVLGSTTLTFQNVTQGFAPINSPALLGTPTAPTSAQFDNTKALATTEFVKRALGSLSGGYGISVTRALTSNDIGKRLELADGVTVTLPASSSVPDGSAILISAGPTSLTSRVTVAAGDQLAMNNLAVAVPYTLAAGGDFIAIREANVWRCHFGSEPLRTSSVFAAIFGTDANQMLPSGWTFKIGHASTNGSTGTVPVTFPVAFPTACMYVGAIYAGGSSATNPALCQSSVPTRTGFTGYLTNVAGNNAAVTTGGFNWLAIGY